MAFVGLGPQGPHGRPAAGIQDALLEGGGIGEAADHPAKGIHLMHQLALGRAPHGRIAGLPGDAIEIQREQRRADAQPRRRERRFAAGVAAAHHNQLEGFGGLLARGNAGIHRFKLGGDAGCGGCTGSCRLP